MVFGISELNGDARNILTGVPWHFKKYLILCKHLMHIGPSELASPCVFLSLNSGVIVGNKENLWAQHLFVSPYSSSLGKRNSIETVLFFLWSRTKGWREWGKICGAVWGRYPHLCNWNNEHFLNIGTP